MQKFGGEQEKSLPRDVLETVLKESVTGVAIVSPHPDGVKLIYTNEAFFFFF